MELPIKIQGVVYAKTQQTLKYLLIKRTPQDGGFWQAITGTMKEGETIIGCLRREISEEIGVQAVQDISQLLETIQWAKKQDLLLLNMFLP